MGQQNKLGDGDVIVKSLREIDRESIAAYISRQTDIERDYRGKWIALYRNVLIGPHDDFAGAFAAVCRREGVTSNRLIRRTWNYLFLRVGDGLAEEREIFGYRFGVAAGADGMDTVGAVHE